LAAYREGESATVLAARYGMSRNYFYEKAQRAGIHKRVAVEVAGSAWSADALLRVDDEEGGDGGVPAPIGALGEQTGRLEAGGPGHPSPASAPGHVWP
jgi:hypothetical protein